MLRSLAEADLRPREARCAQPASDHWRGTATRVGAVSYLNSKPLVHGLSSILPEDRFRLDYPSRLADDLAAGQLDVALIPSVEYLRNPEYSIVSDACVATHGPVLSVKLYSRVPIGDIRSLALDEGSRTSAALTRLMLAERYGVIPRLEQLPLSRSTADSACDAVLLIGDRAIHPPAEEFEAVWDLGEEWVNWTGFPFVFAMWVARPGAADPALSRLLSETRDMGVKNIDQIAAAEAAGLNISEKTARDYLRDNLHFRLGSAERKGLELFRELLEPLQLIPGSRSGSAASRS